MSPNRGGRSLTRRQFLKVTGSAGIALAAHGLVAPAATARASAPIAVLLPASNRTPTLSTAFLAGVDQALAAAGHPAAVERVAIGAGQADAPARLEQVLAANARTITIGLMGADAAAQLHPTLERHGATIVAADLGANVVRYHERSPRVLHVSLGAWQAAYALGQWEARSARRRAAVAISFYESGYDLPYAFRLGYERAGGSILTTAITHLPTSAPGDLDAALAQIAAADPEVVYAAYSGDEATAFVQAYAASALAGRVPLVGSGLLVDSPQARQAGAAIGARTASAWGADAGQFALLGYEAAQLALRAAERRAAAGAEADFDGLHIESPRGTLAIDPHTGGATGPITLRELRATAAGPQSVAVATLADASADDPALAELRTTPRTGWLNAYLCV